MKITIKKIKKLLFDRNYRWSLLRDLGCFDSMRDDVYLKRMFEIAMGYELNLDNPQTYNEKLQWLKLHDHNPRYTTMVDKYAVKDYVASIIGKEYIIPTLGVWDKFDDIDFNALPNQFVLKCTHDSGGLVICKDKNKFDINSAAKKINKSLKYNFYYYGREWPYKNVKSRIIAEKYMEEGSEFGLYEKEMKNSLGNKTKEISSLRDYKIYTFNGEAKMCMINQDRGHHTRADYFDRDYNWFDFTWGYDHADVPPEKPRNYEKMFELAEKLAVGTVELRVDFYEVDGKIYFGELTFFDGSGFDKIEPKSYDEMLGSWMRLPNME